MNKQQEKFREAVIHCHKVTKTPSDFGNCVGDKLKDKKTNSIKDEVKKQISKLKVYGIGYVKVG